MKKSVRSVISKFGFIAIALSLNFFAACEIGLGSSVDVEAPKIEFSESTVESGAVVRDAFAVFGNWNDDGSIGSITATLKNLSTGAEFSKTGTVGENSWNVSFNPASEAIPDGSYELSVVIKDTAEHETKISRSFIIDNTPPLVVLSRPSTKLGATLAGADSFDSYGQKFTLEGKAADDNDVSLIEVKVYADAACTGSPLKTISLPNVPLTIETDVAEYSSTEPNDYSVIYGHVDGSGIAQRNGGDETRYCKLVVYDGAQRYPADGSAQTEADKKGNSIDYYYLNSDISSLFTEGYKITELYHILNGTYTGSARSTSPNGVAALLNSASKKITTGQFNINPDNSPRFKVSARDPLDLTNPSPFDSQGMTVDNSKLEIEITPGLDGNALLPATIGIYLLECDENGVVSNPDNKIWLIGVNQATADEISVSGSIYKYRTQYNIGTAHYPELHLNSYYIIKVAGYDEGVNGQPGNSIVPDADTDFGFQLKPNGNTVDLVSLQTQQSYYTYEDSSIPSTSPVKTITNTFSIFGGSGNYTIERKFEFEDESTHTRIESPFTQIATGYTSSSYTDSISLSDSVHPTKVHYKVKDSLNIESATRSVDINYDNETPTFTDGSLKVKNDPWSATDYYKDTTLKMSGSFIDERPNPVENATPATVPGSGMDTLYYYVQYPGRAAPGTDLTASNAHDDTVSFTQDSSDNTKYNFNFTVADYKDNILNTSGDAPVITPNTLYIQAVDKVGHKSAVSSFTINVDTSAPDLEALYYKVGDNAVSAIGSTVYVNGSSSVTIYGNYNDIESGVNQLTGFALETTGTTGTTSTPLTAEVTYSTSAITTDNASSIPSNFYAYSTYNTAEQKRAIRSFKAVFTPTSGGKLKLEGRNLNWISGQNFGSTTVRPFSISVDSTVPKLSNISITPSNTTVAYKKTEGTNDNYYVDNSDGVTFTFAGVATDNIGVDNVKLEIFDSGSTTAAHTETKTDSEWSFTGIDLSSLTCTSTAPAKAKITVTDVAGNTKIEERRLMFDTTEPKAMHWADAKHKDVYFRIGNANNERKSTDTTSDDYNKVESGQTWDSSLDEGVGSKYSFGSYGNDSTIELRGTFEENGSGLKAVHYKIFSSEPSDANISSLGSTDNPFDGDITVIAEETRRVTYNVNTGTNDAPVYTKNSMTVTSNFRGEIPGFNGTNNFLVLVAEDNVGHKTTDTLAVYGGPDTTPATGNNSWNSSKKYFALNKDTAVPTITSSTGTQATNGSQPITVSGSVSDVAAGVKSVTVSIDETFGTGANAPSITYSAEATITATSSEAGVTKAGTWIITIPANTFNVNGVNAGNVTVYATAKDNAGEGNEKTISAANVIIDKVGPELVIDTTRIKDADDTASGLQINGTIEIKGTASDTNGIRTEASGAQTLKMYYITPAASNGNYTVPSSSVTYGNSLTPTIPTAIEKSTAASDSATKWIELPSATAAHSANWTFSNINTAAIASSDTAKTAFLIVEGYDAAGNVGYSTPVRVVVDQKTDRPKVSISNITLGSTMAVGAPAWLKNTTKIIGTISDDDGIAENGVEICLNPTAATPVWNTVTINGSSFSYDLQNFYTANSTDGTTEDQANGSKAIYFRVRDTGKTTITDTTTNLTSVVTGTTFESAAANSTSAVYLTDGTDTYGNATNASSILYVKVDTKYPEMVLQGAKLSDAGDDAYTTAYNTITLGGTKNSFKVKFTATDTNGIDNTTVTGTAEFPYGTGTDKVTVTATGLTQPSEDDPYYTLTFTLSNAQIQTLKGGTTGTGYDGSINVKITAKDNAGMATSQTASLVYDFKPSAITFTKPDSTTPQSGETSAYGNISENAEVYFTISPSSTVNAGGSVSAWTDGNGGTHNFSSAKTVDAWSQIEDASLGWTIFFDNNLNSATGTHKKTLNKYLIDYGIATKDTNSQAEDAIVSSFDTFVNLYLWIKTIDPAGNVKTDVHTIVVDPQGDRPSLQFSYPSANNGTLGGTVNMYGTATDTVGTNIGVDSVWVQIKSTTHGSDTTTNYGTAPSYNSTTGSVSMTLTEADLDYMVSKGYAVYKRSAYVVGGNNTANAWTTSRNLVSGESADDYAALATLTGAAWNIEINKTKDSNNKAEFDPPEGTSNNPVGIRVYARDGDGKFSLKAERFVRFDADRPVITDLLLVQSTNTELTTASTATKTYNKDMYVKGKWYLTGTVKDKDAIKTLTIGNDTLISNGSVTTGNSSRVALYTENSSGTLVSATTLGTTIKFKYELTPEDGVGTKAPVISATDNANVTGAEASAHIGTENISVRYDNTAPVIVTTAAGGLDIDPEIYQNNKRYRFSSKAKEDPADDNTAQSGFAYTAFYFKRNNTLFDVQRARADASITLATTVPALGSEASTSAANTIVSDSGLYWYRKAITAGSISGNTFTLSNVTGIRISSLMKIDGAFYLVTAINGTSITVDSPIPSNAGIVYAAIAGVVNNTTAEGEGGTIQSDGYYSAPSRDDGDRMIESVDKNGTTWTWEANICSSNMSDGPVTLHYVVFDKAGNSTPGSVNGNVKNNAPRLASLRVWSDFNENGTEQEDESDTFYYMGKPRIVGGTTLERATAITSELVVSGNKKDYNDSGSAFMTVKASTRFIPEIIGGNNELYYSYRYKKNSTTDWTNPVYGATSIGSGYVHGIDEVVDDDGYNVEDEGGSSYMSGRTDLYAANTADSAKHYMEIPGAGTSGSYSLNGIGNSTSSTNPTWFEYTIYDSTDGCTTWGTNPSSTSTTGRLSAKFRVALNLKYQDSENPIVKIRPFYWNGLTENSVYTSKTSVTSVSDLEGHIELENDLPDTFTATGSGVNDRDPKVSGVIKVEGYAYDDIKLKDLYVQFANHSVLNTATKVSTYNGSWTQTAYSSTTGWGFSVYDVYCNADGHLVRWTLTVDTAKQTNIAAVNKAIVVYAIDDRAGHESGHNGTTQTALTTYRWGNVKNQTDAENLYYTDFYYNTKATSLTSDSTIVYKVDTWGSVKSQTNATTTYFTDFYGLTHPTTATTDSTIVYKNTMSSYYKMDIVPYITGVQTRLAKMNKPNPTIYSRTAKGHYPIASDETANGSVILEGFNLAAKTTANPKGTVDISSEIGSKTTGAYSYTVGTGANAVESFNNKNNDNACGSYVLSSNADDEKTNVMNMYNRQPNTITNLKLDDDVYFDMWEINSNAATSGSALKYPVMHINPTDGQIGFGFVRGSDSVSFPANGNSYIWYQKNRKDYVGTNFAYDSNGVAHNVSIGLDAQFDTGIAGRMLYNNSNWYAGNDGATKIKQWDMRYSISLESIGVPNNVYLKGNKVDVDGGKGIIDIERFSTPGIAVSAHSTGTAIYIMYYDSDNDQIRFRYGEVPATGDGRFTTETTGQGRNQTTTTTYTPYGLLNDSKCENYNGNTSNTTIQSDTSDQNDTWAAHDMFEAHRDYYALVAGKYYKQPNDGITGTNNETIDNGTELVDTGNHGSEYNAIAVIPGTTMNDDKVVMIWYDNTTDKLMYIYRTNLGTNDTASNMDAGTTAKTGRVNGRTVTYWSAPEELYSGMLQDCAMTVDKNGGIHIAAYDQGGSNLIYLYKQSYNSTGVYSSVVDAYSQIGAKVSIDTALNASNKVVPYISYYAEGLRSLPKLAYLPDGITTTSTTTIANSVKDGADEDTDLFTGDWEVTMLPTTSKLQNYNVNIGVWKNANGQAYKPAAGTDVATSQDTRKRYANGTTELVLGYAIRNNGVGYIETAMRK